MWLCTETPTDNMEFLGNYPGYWEADPDLSGYRTTKVLFASTFWETRVLLLSRMPKTYRVWCTWPNVPPGYEAPNDMMMTGAYTDRLRAERMLRQIQENLDRDTGSKEIACCVVREELIPRTFEFNGAPSRIVMVFFDADQEQTDLSHLPD